MKDCWRLLLTAQSLLFLPSNAFWHGTPTTFSRPVLRRSILREEPFAASFAATTTTTASTTATTTRLFDSSSSSSSWNAAAAAEDETVPEKKKNATTTDTPTPQQLTDAQKNFVCGYLTAKHPELLVKFVETFTDLGTEMARANAWTGGTMTIDRAAVIDVTTDQLTLQVDCTVKKKARQDTVTLDLTKESTIPDDSPTPIDQLVRRLCRLCWQVQRPAVTGQLLQLALQDNAKIQMGGAGIGKLPENMYLNQVPHNRYVRQYFYDQASEAALQAVALCSQQQQRHADDNDDSTTLPKNNNRMQMIVKFPETNPSMDSYRIGTILELVRAVAIRLAEDNLRVRVCVQESMGVGIFTGLPKQLGGVAKLLQLMDWQSDEGEVNEGMVGDYVRFGGVGPQHVVNTVVDAATGDIRQHQDDVFLLIAPQSMIGTDTSIHPLLQAMVDAAGDRPVILLNPDLTDKPSAAGQQSVRGRQARIDFANSFETIFQFQTIYVSGTSYFPILGARTKLRPTEPYVAQQRRDYRDGQGEIYVPILASETPPTGADILAAFEK